VFEALETTIFEGWNRCSVNERNAGDLCLSTGRSTVQVIVLKKLRSNHPTGDGDSSIGERLDKTFYWFKDHGWVYCTFLLQFLFILSALWFFLQPGPEDRMPDDFNYSESKQAVEQFYGVPCESTANETYSDRYRFECRQSRGNYTYSIDARVKYNKSGRDKVKLYD